MRRDDVVGRFVGAGVGRGRCCGRSYCAGGDGGGNAISVVSITSLLNRPPCVAEPWGCPGSPLWLANVSAVCRGGSSKSRWFRQFSIVMKQLKPRTHPSRSKRLSRLLGHHGCSHLTEREDQWNQCYWIPGGWFRSLADCLLQHDMRPLTNKTKPLLG